MKLDSGTWGLAIFLVCLIRSSDGHATDNPCFKNISPDCSTVHGVENIIISHNNSCVFECIFDGKQLKNSLQVEAHLLSDLKLHKLFLTIEQEDEVTSYTLPFFTSTQIFTSMREELCPNSKPVKIRFTLSTPNTDAVSINFGLAHVALQIMDNNLIKEHVSPFSPRTLMLSWGDGLSDVLVTTNATAGRDVCAVLVLRHAKCPLKGGPKYLGELGENYQTFTKKGALRASRNDFPDGIFIIVYSLLDDHQCTGLKDDAITQRGKGIAITYHKAETLSESLVVIWVTGTVVVFAIIAISLAVYRIMYRNFMYIVNLQGHSLKDILNPHISVDSSPSNEESTESAENSGGMIQAQPISESLVVADNQVEEVDDYTLPDSVSFLTETFNPSVLSWWSAVEKFENTLPLSRTTHVGFHYNIMLVGSLLLEPLIEVIKSYTSHSRSHDFCIFNERCSVNAGPIQDFPRFLSSGIYCVCALGFYFLISQHEKYTSAIKRLYRSMDAEVGLDYNYSLLKSLAYGLFLQGVMSALYHLCPNKATLHFDMLFMYVLSITLMLHLHSLRHSSVYQSVYSTFAVVIVALFLVKFKNGMPTWLFWTFLLGVHAIITLSVSFLLTKVGVWNLNPFVLRKMWKGWPTFQNSFNPEAKFNALTVLRVSFGLTVNMVLALVGLSIDMNPYMYILFVCVSNLVMYSLHYLLTKFMICKERGRSATMSLIVCICGLSCWIAGLVFYGLKSSDSSLTSAQSNALNTPCILFNIFSYHDLWHLASAFGLFFSFIGFLTLDDDMICTNIKRIKVF